MPALVKQDLKSAWQNRSSRGPLIPDLLGQLYLASGNYYEEVEENISLNLRSPASHPASLFRLLYQRQSFQPRLRWFPFSPLTPPLLTPLCCTVPPRAFQSPDPPRHMDLLSPSWTTLPVTLPRPVDQSAPPWLLPPYRHPYGSSSLPLPSGIALVSFSICLRHGLPGLQLHFIPPPHQLRWALPSLQLRLGPQSHRLRLSHPAPWFLLSHSSPWLDFGLQDLWCCPVSVLCLGLQISCLHCWWLDI
ncbi:hypothetical protein DPX16_8217 [Anabarilius grahami]|uniref:Uncharacterized protein n=1 Tax=Anabarilius grahami TaxID=495550 RepID=A0A3N0Y9H2_ANAGA|nr:hypothetical protein DPX16_8217 [Anabarilius grahami]